MTDEMYEHLVYDDFVFTTPAQIEPSLHDRTLTVNGVSKAYCMTGWRIGYAGGPAELIKAMATIQSQSTSNPSSIAQWAAVEALNGPQDSFRRTTKCSRSAATSRSRCSTRPRHRMPASGRRVLCLSVLRRHDRQDRAVRQGDRERRGFVTELLETEGVAVVQGSAFGLGPHSGSPTPPRPPISRRPASVFSASAEICESL